MSEQNINKIRTDGKVVASKGDLSLVKIYLGGDGTPDVLFTIIERFRNDIVVIGVGLFIDEAFLDAKRRADAADNMAILQKVEALEKEYYSRIYERGRE